MPISNIRPVSNAPAAGPLYLVAALWGLAGILLAASMWQDTTGLDEETNGLVVNAPALAVGLLCGAAATVTAGLGAVVQQLGRRAGNDH